MFWCDPYTSEMWQEQRVVSARSLTNECVWLCIVWLNSDLQVKELNEFEGTHYTVSFFSSRSIYRGVGGSRKTHERGRTCACVFKV